LEARAANGDPVLMGQANEATAATTIGRTTHGPTLRVRHTGIDLEEGGPALDVSSWYGDALTVFVDGTSQTAIRSTSQLGIPLIATSEIDSGVDATGRWGVTAHGWAGGVYAETTASTGTAVQAVSTHQDGHALLTTGRIQFGQASGVTAIATGSKQVTVKPAVKVSAATKVLTTLQSSAGGTTVVHRISRNTAANSFTIYLTKTATQRCYVAWLLIG
jgi:hypothetical protein